MNAPQSDRGFHRHIYRGFDIVKVFWRRAPVKLLILSVSVWFLFILNVAVLHRETLRIWKISVDDRKLFPTDISIHRHKRLARCIHVRQIFQFWNIRNNCEFLATSPARSAYIQYIATYVHVAWSVCVSVCLFVFAEHTGELSKNGWIDWDAVWDRMCPRNLVFDRRPDRPTGIRYNTIWYGRFTCAQKLTRWPA